MGKRKLKLSIWVWIALFAALLAACRPAVVETALPGAEEPHGPTAIPGWKAYTNSKYGFTLQYPSDWQVVELPNETYTSAIEQVWFASGELPPPNTGAAPDVAVWITRDNPTPNWEPQYFDDYAVELLVQMPVEATLVMGVNKESGAQERVMIARVGEVYLQVRWGGSRELQAVFDQIAFSLRPVE